MSNPIINFALRGVQVIFSVIVLGLSVGLIRGQYFKDDVPAALGYAAFVGGISLLGAFIGIASSWVEILQGIIGGGIDIVITLFNLAGGIIIAVKLKGINCDKETTESRLNMALNELLNGGCIDTSEGRVCGYGIFYGSDKLYSRCKQNQADSAFMFLTAIILIACVTITLLRLRK